ncbi:MAG: hypothetical protein P8N43_14345 [Alphaproteobacteria bacterium]|jgi:hypothetical protein|nr:hypothetical protein [Alphaproteobacteria bacterium]
MKRAFLIRCVFVLALIALLVPSASRDGIAASKFISGFDDLPLMPEMTEIPDTDVSFDTTAGRIVIAFARSSVSQEKIMAFYGTALAQLGWRKQSQFAYLREGEALSFDYLTDGPDTIVRFSLLPQ